MGKTPQGGRGSLVQNNLKRNQSSYKQWELGARQSPRMLVVEKDPVVLQLKVEVLSQHGGGLKTAEAGAAAWAESQAIHHHRAKSI